MEHMVVKTARYNFLLLTGAPLLVLVVGIFSFEMVSDCGATAKDIFLTPFRENDSATVAVFGREMRARYTLMVMSLLMYFVSASVMLVSIYTIVRNVGCQMALALVTITVFAAGVILALVFALPFLEPFCGGKLIYQFPREALATSVWLTKLLGQVSAKPTWPSVAGWINILAIALGILAAKLAVVAAATTLIGGNAGRKIQRDAYLAKQISNQRRLLYCGTLVLTAAVLSMGAWLHWPAALLAEPEAHNAMMDWANGVMLYWGGVFTLYLFATYVPAATCLQARARLLADRRGNKKQYPNPDKWLEARALKTSPTSQIPPILAILGPLLASPLNSVFTIALSLGG